MAEHRDENRLSRDITRADHIADRSTPNVTDLIRFLHKYSVDKLRSICVDDSDFDAVIQEVSKLLHEVIPNFREWDGTFALAINTALPEGIDYATIRPYMTSKWIRLSQSYLKLYGTALQNLYIVYSKWLGDSERICDEEQFKRHKKCVGLLKRFVYITRTISYTVDEATVAMKIYDVYKLITLMIKNGVVPPLELFYRVLDS